MEPTFTVQQATGDKQTPAILVVARSAFMRLRCKDLFRENGFTTVEASTVADALQMYASAQPMAVVLDGTAMDAHGLVALRAIMAHDPMARVVFVTAEAKIETVLEVAQAGARDFVVKPFEPARLLQAVRRVVAPPTERQATRVPVTLRARIGFGATAGDHIPCLIEDLSTGGARCNLSSPLSDSGPAPGMITHLTFTLPDEQGPMSMVGRVARTIAPGIIAVAFMSVSKSHTDRIEAFCQHVLRNNSAITVGSAEARRSSPPAA